MAIINLNKGKITLVDDDMFEYLNQWKWSCVKGYAMRSAMVDGAHKTIYMHTMVNCTPAGYQTDHINRDPLDNRKINLRTATKSQNGCNRDIASNNTSGFKGVSWHKSNNAWRAIIKINGKAKHLGLYDNIIDAANAYNEYAKKLHGDFALLNIVKGAL